MLRERPAVDWHKANHGGLAGLLIHYKNKILKLMSSNLEVNWKKKCEYLRSELEDVKYQLSDYKTINQLNKEALSLCLDPKQL